MSISAAHSAAFFAELAQSAAVWTIEDADGIPAPVNPDGDRAMPFWSKATRAQTVVDRVDAYRGFTVREIPLDEWRERWLPGLTRDGLLVGINWSGARASGYDLPAGVVLSRVAG